LRQETQCIADKPRDAFVQMQRRV